MTYRPIPTEEVFARLPKQVREDGAARAEQLILEYTTRLVRETVSSAKKDIATNAELLPDAISGKEKQLRLMINTLEKRVSALGGKLRLVIEFPDKPAVTLSLKGRIISRSKASPPG